MGRAVADRPCPNGQCAFFGELRTGNIVLYGFLRLRRLTFRDIFTAVATFLSLLALLIRVGCCRQAPISRFAAP